MYIPNELINLILSFLDNCNECKKIIIEERFYKNENKKSICLFCRDKYYRCNMCKILFKESLYCEVCKIECKSLCKICVQDFYFNKLG